MWFWLLGCTCNSPMLQYVPPRSLWWNREKVLPSGGCKSHCSGELEWQWWGRGKSLLCVMVIKAALILIDLHSFYMPPIGNLSHVKLFSITYHCQSCRKVGMKVVLNVCLECDLCLNCDHIMLNEINCLSNT